MMCKEVVVVYLRYHFWTYLEGLRLQKPVTRAPIFFHVPLLWAPRHEGVLGSGGITPSIIDLGSRWRWVVSFTRLPLYPQGKSPWHPLDKRLDGPQSRSGRGGIEKNSRPLSEFHPLIIQLVAQSVFENPMSYPLPCFVVFISVERKHLVRS